MSNQIRVMNRSVDIVRIRMLWIAAPYVLCGLMLIAMCDSAFAADFALRDGDTVAFLGDSITAARTYGKLIENYTLLRFPDRKIRFINVGIGGDTAAGGLARLQRDVFDRGATVVTVAYGINDIAWGFHADEEHRTKFLTAIEEIVRQCRHHGVRVYICSAACTGTDSDRSENQFLQAMCDEAMKRARELGGQSIDVQRTMRDVQKRVLQANETITDQTKKESLHVVDNVHLSDMGQTAMAYAILRGLNAPELVSSVKLDSRQKRLIESVGCKVTDVAWANDRIEFTRLDEGLPLNAETFFALHFRFIPIHEEMNRYLLQIQSLPDRQYELSVDGRKVGAFSAKQLDVGVNISSNTPDPWIPGGPWDSQANILHSLTESRHKLDFSASLTKANLQESGVTREYLESAAKLNAEIEALQRKIAKPQPYRFVVQPVAVDAK